ncbi:helix-turn-helix domain-containing protein [Bradyrhizobium sp. 956_D2_N1_5]|uniref:helix-turn-helix domain-containing protein n=1 Tax=unclassified Bradyrhizobium TaxID=2631580 RepID=UPI003F22A0FA
MSENEARIAPRLLTLKEAARYCGISVPVFLRICTTKAIALGPGPRLRRFDRQSLDEWIDQLKNTPASRDWLAEMDRTNERTQN